MSDGIEEALYQKRIENLEALSKQLAEAYNTNLGYIDQLQKRIEQLEALSKQLAEACQCTLTLFGVELEEGAWCGGLKPMLDAALEAARKARVIDG